MLKKEETPLPRMHGGESDKDCPVCVALQKLGKTRKREEKEHEREESAEN